MKNQKYACDICEKVFKSTNGVKHHIQNHDKIIELKCNICERIFMRNSGLRNHFRKCHDEEAEITYMRNWIQ